MTTEAASDVERREVCFLIGAEDTILWSDASTSPVALPDSRARWEAIWTRRDRLEEIAHSHPIGPLHFSGEDRTTMAALWAALGRPIRFSVVTPEGMIRSEREGHEELVADEPWWTNLLRSASGVSGR